MSVISNTSPLFYLYHANSLDLLHRLYGRILVPPAVEFELERGNQAGFNVPQINNIPWIEVQLGSSAEQIPTLATLGAGEAEVIMLGLENPNSLLILDDLPARQIAEMNQLRYTGTLGILLVAKQTGYLTEVRPIIDTIRQAGMWLSDSLVEMVLRQAGETSPFK